MEPYTKEGKSFKAPNGIYYTRTLFWELTKYKERAVFTTKWHDHEGCYSLPKLYLESTDIDPSEYDFAENILGGMIHWNKIKEANPLRGMVNDMIAVAKARDISKSMKYLQNEVDTGGKAAFGAAKLLLSDPLKRVPRAPLREAAKSKDEKVTSIVSDLNKRLGIS